MKYSLNEIVQIAVQIEDTGYEFYSTCAEVFKGEQLRDTFKFLAKQELEHKQYFESLASFAEKSEGSYTDDYYSYLRSIGDKKVFQDEPENRASAINPDKPGDAIRQAFTDEKNSIIFYTELKTMYSDDYEALEILERIIEEERSHIVMLKDILESIEKYA